MKNKHIILAISLAFLLIIAGCKQASQPQPAFQTPCRQFNSLTCRSASATGGIFCCMNIFNQNAATGYVCVLGRDYFAGCYNSLEQARKGGCRGTIVRCVRE